MISINSRSSTWSIRMRLTRACHIVANSWRSSVEARLDKTACSNVIMGGCGCLLGLPLGMTIMWALGRLTFHFPGTTQPTPMPIDWGWQQFVVAALFAMLAAVGAAFLPARKAAAVNPVDILRGAGA